MNQGQTAIHPATTPSSSTVRPLILLVDDDAIVRSLAKHHLGQAGYEVITLAAGGATVETFLDRRPEAVLLDVMLPDTDGFALCRALRQIPEAAYLPIVMLTSLNDEQAIPMAFESGASEFVAKPINWLHEGYRLRYLLRASANLRDLDQARQTITQAKQEWEKTFDAIEDPVLLLNPDLTIRRANQAAARMGERSCAAMIGRRCNEIFKCRFTGSEDCPAKQALARGTPVHTELYGYGPQKAYDVLASVAPVLSGERKSPTLVYTIKDITEYRELQRELLHAQKMEALGVLAAGVAHDFNNLLQGIVGWAELLSRETPTKAQLQEALGQLSGLAANGRALTQQLLFTARKAEGQKRAISPKSLLEEVAALLARTQPKAIGIETEVPENLWKVDADRSHLHQLLMNLAVNAVQAMPDGGCLRLQAANIVLDEDYCRTHPESQAGSHVLLMVADTGKGIDKGLLPRIYEPFFTTKAPGEGTGLGLSIAFGIVRDHGGHIRCYSEPGQGTTFRIYLPALTNAPDDETDRPSQRTDGKMPSGNGKTLLLAEDEPLILTLLVKLLERHQYQVVKTTNGKEAMEYFLTHRDQLDAIVLDMNMPVMNGDECLKELRHHGCEAPIILTTGALLSAQRQAELLRQAAGIVTKPFYGPELLEVLGQVMSL